MPQHFVVLYVVASAPTLGGADAVQLFPRSELAIFVFEAVIGVSMVNGAYTNG
jgi:hypothetical protein